MSCLISSGYSLSCDSAGGVAEWLFINYDEIDSITITGGEVTTLTLSTGASAYKFQVNPESSTFTDKAIGSEENRSYGREQSCEITLHGNTKELIVTTELMAQGRIVLLASLNDGSYELLFHEGGAKILDERTSGMKFDDANANKLTATHRQKTKAPKVGATVVSALPVV
jgi:hypothetical protein